MKNIYEILKEFGLELPAEKKADFEKEKEAAELENYKAAWRQRVKKFNAQRHKGEEVDT